MNDIERREIFARIHDRFKRLYGADGKHLIRRLKLLLGVYEDLLPGIRPPQRWTAADNVLITYGDTVHHPDEKPLATLKRFCDDHLAETINTIHILPFFPWSSDDGFSVIDYRKVDPALGKWSHVDALGERFRLMFDLVLNHCSKHSEWFRDYLTGIAPMRYYFHEVEPGTDLSQVTRPRKSPLLTKVRTRAGERWVWTTFSDDQIDLNFANPDVLLEFVDILLMYITHGAHIVRLDAIAYLWKTIGTECIHLPQTHEVVKLMRDLIDLVAPATLLLTETNVPHEQNVSYFGRGDEAHVVYNFSLPPLLLHALSTGDGTTLTQWAADQPDPPPGCTFLNFTASHDGIGVRPLEGILAPEKIQDLADHVRARRGYVSEKSNPDGSTSPYELNITYFSALGDASDDPKADPAQHVKRFLCSQAIALGLRGIPAVYFHSLTATENDHDNVETRGYPRAINRGKWDDQKLRDKLADKTTAASQVFSEYTRMLRVRSDQPAFSPDAKQVVHKLDPRIFAFERTSPDGRQTILCASNLTGKRVTLDPPQHLELGSLEGATGLITGRKVETDKLVLAPYQTRWFTHK